MSANELNTLVDKIKDGLKTAGMTDYDTKDTLNTLFEVLYEEIVNGAIEELDFDTFKKLENMTSDEITPEVIDGMLGLNLETITKQMSEKLALYNENLQKSLPLLKQQYERHRLSTTVMGKLKNYI